MKYNFWNLLVDILICAAAWLALYHKKVAEILEGVYWIYFEDKNALIIVNIANKGKKNCVFDTNSALLFMKDETDIVKSYEFKNKTVVPPNCSTNFNFTISQTQYIKEINDIDKLSCCVNTKNGTIIKLVKGMNG